MKSKHKKGAKRAAARRAAAEKVATEKVATEKVASKRNNRKKCFPKTGGCKRKKFYYIRTYSMANCYFSGFYYCFIC